MRFHSQNFTDGSKPMWRHGRAWVGPLAFEWKVPSGRPGVAVGLRGFSVSLFLFSLYVSWGRSGDYFPKQFSIYWLDGCLWVSHPFEREMEWRSTDPWWRKAVCLHVVDWLIGAQKFERRQGQPFETFVPMPEGSYLAKAKPETLIWRRRWYWPEKRSESVWLEIPGGISHSGKGESGYDCDDALCGIGGESVEDAVANAVRSSLRSRRRYGLDSAGTGRAPLRVVNAVAAN